MKVTVIGTGAYGLALALSLAKNKNDVMMWTENESTYQEFLESHQLKSILDVDIPKNIHLTTSYEKALADSSLILLVPASKYIDVVCQKMKPFYQKKTPICVATKGIEESTEELLSNIVENVLETKNVAVISGPTFAIDMAHEEPVALALGSKNAKTRDLVIEALSHDRLKLRPTKDIIGIQLCGAVKNIIAIAAGILKGLGYSESTQAFLINESLHDIKNIIYYLGGNPKTILSFAGVGDLTLTCTSTKSRNFSFGYVIGSTKDPKKIRKYLDENTVEGYFTLNTVYKLLRKKSVRIPLITTIYNVVYNDEDPNTLATFLIEKE